MSAKDAPKDDDFTLGEARRQISAIWGRIDNITESLEELNDSMGENREIMLGLGSKVDNIVRLLETMSGAEGMTRCVRNLGEIKAVSGKVDALEKEIVELKNAKPCARCKNDTRLVLIESQLRIIKWIGGILALALGSLAATGVVELSKLIAKNLAH